MRSFVNVIAFRPDFEKIFLTGIELTARLPLMQPSV
jgi:hypothetical protein